MTHDLLHLLWGILIAIIGFFLQRFFKEFDNLWGQVEKLRSIDIEHERVDTKVAMEFNEKIATITASQAETRVQLATFVSMFSEVKADLRDIRDRLAGRK
jgi:hypothetical protein